MELFNQDKTIAGKSDNITGRNKSKYIGERKEIQKCGGRAMQNKRNRKF